MAIAMDKCKARVSVRDACIDDVKATTVKEKENKIKDMSIVYGDVPKPKYNLDLLHKPNWCARPRPGDARSALITIFACSLLQYKGEH